MEAVPCEASSVSPLALLTTEVVASLQCSICHASPMLEPSSIACGHSFCLACIDRWLLHRRECPACRAAIPRRSPLDSSKRAKGTTASRGSSVTSSMPATPATGPASLSPSMNARRSTVTGVGGGAAGVAPPSPHGGAGGPGTGLVRAATDDMTQQMTNASSTGRGGPGGDGLMGSCGMSSSFQAFDAAIMPNYALREVIAALGRAAAAAKAEGRTKKQPPMKVPRDTSTASMEKPNSTATKEPPTTTLTVACECDGQCDDVLPPCELPPAVTMPETPTPIAQQEAMAEEQTHGDPIQVPDGGLHPTHRSQHAESQEEAEHPLHHHSDQEDRQHVRQEQERSHTHEAHRHRSQAIGSGEVEVMTHMYEQERAARLAKSSSDTASFPIAGAVYRLAPRHAPNMLLGVKDGMTTAGAPVVLWLASLRHCNASAQQWKVVVRGRVPITQLSSQRGQSGSHRHGGLGDAYNDDDDDDDDEQAEALNAFAATVENTAHFPPLVELSATPTATATGTATTGSGYNSDVSSEGAHPVDDQEGPRGLGRGSAEHDAQRVTASQYISLIPQNAPGMALTAVWGLTRRRLHLLEEQAARRERAAQQGAQEHRRAQRRRLRREERQAMRAHHNNEGPEGALGRGQSTPPARGSGRGTATTTPSRRSTTPSTRTLSYFLAHGYAGGVCFDDDTSSAGSPMPAVAQEQLPEGSPHHPEGLASEGQDEDESAVGADVIADQSITSVVTQYGSVETDHDHDQLHGEITGSEDPSSTDSDSDVDDTTEDATAAHRGYMPDIGFHNFLGGVAGGGGGDDSSESDADGAPLLDTGAFLLAPEDPHDPGQQFTLQPTEDGHFALVQRNRGSVATIGKGDVRLTPMLQGAERATARHEFKFSSGSAISHACTIQ